MKRAESVDFENHWKNNSLQSLVSTSTEVSGFQNGGAASCCSNISLNESEIKEDALKIESQCQEPDTKTVAGPIHANESAFTLKQQRVKPSQVLREEEHSRKMLKSDSSHFDASCLLSGSLARSKIMEATKYVQAASTIQKFFRNYRRMKKRSKLALCHVLSSKKEEIIVSRKKEYEKIEKAHSKKLKLLKEKEEQRKKRFEMIDTKARGVLGMEGEKSKITEATDKKANNQSSKKEDESRSIVKLLNPTPSSQRDPPYLSRSIPENQENNCRILKEICDGSEEPTYPLSNVSSHDIDTSEKLYLSKDHLSYLNSVDQDKNLPTCSSGNVNESEKVAETRDRKSDASGECSSVNNICEKSKCEKATTSIHCKEKKSLDVAFIPKNTPPVKEKESKAVKAGKPTASVSNKQYGNLSQTKVNTILSYLDQIEKEDDHISIVSHAKSIATTATLNTAIPQHLGNLNGFNGVTTVHSTHSNAESGLEGNVNTRLSLDFDDSGSLVWGTGGVVNDEVKSQIIQHQLEIDHQRKAVNLLKDELKKQREETKQLSVEKNKSEKMKLVSQKKEYEQIIKRHLQFIDQLMEDKKLLTNKCETLLEDLKILDKKMSSKVASMQENHAKEMKNQKEVVLAAEKIKRENWIAEKTKKIKELTIKGLEPEIQRMVSNHKQELKSLKLSHHQEVLKLRHELTENFESKMEETRKKLTQERDEAATKEREVARQRYEKQTKEDEKEFLGQRQRLQNTFNEERQQLKDSYLKEQEKNKSLSSVYEAKMKECIEELSGSHKQEIDRLKERLQIEKEEWQDLFMKKQEQARVSNENAMKQQLKKQRDKEIEMVIARLEHETTKTQISMESEIGTKTKEVEARYAKEIGELKASERTLSDKYIEALDSLKSLEEDHRNVKKMFSEKSTEHDTLKKLANKLSAERAKVTEKVRDEFIDKILKLEKENTKVKKELEGEREREERVVADIIKAKDEELENLNRRVRTAVAKKDSIIVALKEQLQAQDLKIVHMENFLQEKRKELLK